ncbi:hypothetical protein OIV83_002033 [Microbotryomycetes sp. JL201]|nr:hypothetical protein OIV83_002033 [Microbotryomycetes sp. JL201]
MPIPYSVVDAFTSDAFSGNPASVICQDVGSDELKQKIANEFNLAETAFTKPLEDHTAQEPHLELRWFTPEVEAPLCGHATLATTAVLFSQFSPIEISPDARQIVFESIKGAGQLVARKLSSTRFSLDFPAEDVDKIVNLQDGPEFDEQVDILTQACPSLAGHVLRVCRLTKYGVLIEVSPSINIEHLQVNAQTLMQDKQEPLLTILTSPTPKDASRQDRDVFSRVFAPCAGIPEDPVTGAAHTCIAPYWLATEARTRLNDARFEDDKVNEIKCRQVSARGGDVDVTYEAQAGRVHLVGETKIVMRGEIL